MPTKNADDFRSAGEEFERVVRPMSIGMQTTGGLIVLIAWIIAPPHYEYQTWLLAGLLSVLAIFIPLCLFKAALVPLSVVNVWIISHCLAVIAGPSPDRAFWSYVLCVSIMLCIATLYLRVRDYMVTIIGVVLILGHGRLPIAPVSINDAAWGVLTTCAIPLIGVFLNLFFAKWHRNNFQLKLDLQALAYKDPLTGLANRRKLIQDMTRHGSTLGSDACCFLMIDVDDFKSVNDEFGHDTGDTVLVRIADVLREVLGSDSVGRMGGEEFGAWTATGGRARALELAVQILAQVRQIRLGERSLTVSIGIADAGSTVSELIRNADGALYEAKRLGKNQAVFTEKTRLTNASCPT